ncbi:MAG: NUDIX domain-containing protein [Rhodospirillales bacterium]|nr:NUDIX domain-containing protein [Rhodospirillales bacterium]
MSKWGGVFPETAMELRTLPGVGSYTSAAIAAIVFGERIVPVDGNVLRVLARIYGLAEPLPRLRTRIEKVAQRLAPSARPGDFAQALMDLGAMICIPKQPLCPRCPWKEHCLARASGNPETLPVREPPRDRPVRYGVAFWLERSDGSVLFRRRPATGLLGGMMEIPSTDWRASPWPEQEAIAIAPLSGDWCRLENVVDHTFTHLQLMLSVFQLVVNENGDHRIAPAGGQWVEPEKFGELALPTLMRKIVRSVNINRVSPSRARSKARVPRQNQLSELPSIRRR